MPSWISDHLDAWLGAVFFAHWLPFVWISWRRRTWRYASTVAVFSFLVALQILRVLDVDAPLGPVTLQGWMRALAYLSLGITLTLLVWRRVAARRPSSRLPPASGPG